MAFVLITKTCLYNFDPLKPHFHIVKLGFTGVYIEAVLTSTHNLYFEQKYEKYQNFLSENFHFLVVKFSVYLNRHVFVMCRFLFLISPSFCASRGLCFEIVVFLGYLHIYFYLFYSL